MDEYRVHQADVEVMGKELIPADRDINVYDSLDEQRACKHFLGKNLHEAEVLFRKNSLTYQEDLMWMGPVAFRFYVEAAIRYIMSIHARDDSDMINCFAGLLKFWLEVYPQELVPVAQRLITACRFIIRHWNRFHVDPYLYGDLRKEYVTLVQMLQRIGPTGQ